MPKLTFKYRTEEEEIMDDFSLEGDELREALDKIASINQFLGGNQLTLQGVKKLLNSKDEITIVDVGCGNGHFLNLMDNNFEFDYPHVLAALTALVDE